MNVWLKINESLYEIKRKERKREKLTEGIISFTWRLLCFHLFSLRLTSSQFLSASVALYSSHKNHKACRCLVFMWIRSRVFWQSRSYVLWLCKSKKLGRSEGPFYVTPVINTMRWKILWRMSKTTKSDENREK